ncbi:DUF3077 domain-containing protein [Pseudomonas sp. 21615526]|jgi:hypothetical protein|uniref:DUF6124 family protein n=1 Tax=unclassified Pseudomonas TaxID=196821 RepID=UPI000B3FFC01|nr:MULTISPECIES: DUF3077 domain-containing protein [unclassified Pseudomonas]NVZ32402.1 DUF3077 domain-containing protein [Pseudomonas sp. A4002]NVZ36681.1 DUF3077 domain-containing protein [Pseudomonas sp. 21615526]NWB10579.1 DUF3077 domain-containing protein [Pseudomonas sp. D5002]NWB80817.1 DUF3077 domain-containing protein [Pseudomonas sp. F9001]NWC69841.1 DUF3077 domain-containing protein [Pseudomonas sp. P7758]
MDKSLPEPPSDCFVVSEDLSFEDALLYTSHLLNSASATALDCRDTMQHHDRAKIQAVWHLLEMAKAMVDRSIECLHPRKT